MQTSRAGNTYNDMMAWTSFPLKIQVETYKAVLVIPNKTERREEKDDIERESFDYIFESGG